MYAKLALAALLVAMAVASPTPDGWGGSHKHVKIHVPYTIKTIHKHHVEKVPYPVHVPVVKEVQVVKEVPIYKHVPVPVVKHVPYPVIQKEVVEKPVYIPVHHETHHKEEHHGGWESESLSQGWD